MYRNKRIYLSGPYTNCKHIAPKVFDEAKQYLIKHGAMSVWSPTDEIDEKNTWQQAMDICNNALVPNKIDLMVIINNEYTRESKGVEQEIAWAKERHIRMHFLQRQPMSSGTTI